MSTPHPLATEGPPKHAVLRRDVGVLGATLMGLGSIVGTGVFVSIAIAAGIAGPAVILAIALAAVVALCNALSSAQLAANHPVSGGSYEYGYRYLRPWLGFTAGWLFLAAKSASAATAALGFSGYLLEAFGVADRTALVATAFGIVVALGLVVLSGVKQSSRFNAAVVSVSLLALFAFVVSGIPAAAAGGENLRPFLPEGPAALLHAAALMFVAYTGYGRISTLGEEVREPRRTIPLAILATLGVSAAVYVAVAAVGVGAAGSAAMAESTSIAASQAVAPLAVVAESFGRPGVARFVAIGAMAAMLGVLLNLILGLSRVLLAMGRRGDMPAATARLNAAKTTPYVAVVVVTIIIAGLTLLGSVKTTWSFSAFTVLIYYGITNLAALRLPREARLYSPVFAWGGLAACLVLGLIVDHSGDNRLFMLGK
ncbi:MAG: amino acid permease [Planctomycetota bacterium]|nr:MAG: amino acid permease [Planctomycetota bacterium]